MVAAEEALGWTPGTFMETYTGNREDANRLEIEASPVASAVVRFAEKERMWTGTATRLRAVLKEHVDVDTTHTYRWPADGKALSGQLKRVAGALRGEGIEVSWGKSGSRTITIRKTDDKKEDAQNPNGVVPQSSALGAADDRNTAFPTFPPKEIEEREAGKAAKPASGASTASKLPDSGRCSQCGGLFARRDLAWLRDELVCVVCYEEATTGQHPREHIRAEDVECSNPEGHRQEWHVYQWDKPGDFRADCPICLPY